MSQQQTVLRVLTNIPDTISGTTWSTGTTYGPNEVAQYDGLPYVSLVTGNTNNVPPSSPSFWNPITQYEFLDLYGDIPIRLNKSVAELQDIGKKNSDYSVGLMLPGSKKNNRFFENFFNVDSQSLFFDATQRVNIDVLLNDQQIRAVGLITISYLVLYLIGTIAGMIFGYPLLDSLFESTSAAANVGLSCGITDTSMPGALKVIYIIQMWMGRLEFISVFALIGFFVALITGKE